MDCEDFWPARNVAEFAYCPRLFYFMEVEGIHIASEDTVSGIAKHKRVDKPSHLSNENRPEHSSLRSLTLSSDTLQLRAVIDRVDIQGNSAVPIEYRKGSPRSVQSEGSDIQLNAWPTDRVQVVLQGILLEENGYCVPQCEIYYFKTNQKVIVAFDETAKRDALEVLKNAKAASALPRPAPLVNDARCPKCSLFTICLPDEIHSLSQERTRTAETADSSETNSVAFCEDRLKRKIWPSCDEGNHLVVQSNGSKIGVSGQCLKVTNSDGKKLHDFPLAGVESVVLVGNTQISTQAVHTLAERKVSIAYVSPAGRMLAWIDPLDSVSSEVRRQQVRKLDATEQRLTLAKAIIAAKIRSQRLLLMRNGENVAANVLDALSQEAKKVESVDNIDSLRGHEGQAAAIYFGNFAKMLAPEFGKLFEANGRKRRPAPDPVNAVLSFAYTMLAHECTTALRVARLEPSIGALHSSRPGRPALSLDLMEPFRPLIADSIAITAFNRSELRAGHFHQTAAGCVLSDHGRAAFFSVYGRRMDDEITHPVFGYKLSYRRMIHLHARMISAWIIGEIDKLAFLTTR